MRYSPKTDKFIGKYDNHRVLQGLKEHCDKVTSVFDEKVKGTFGIISRVKTTDKKGTCDEGHKLEYVKESQYSVGMGIYCDSCGKGISSDTVKEGIYVCKKDRADYHKECVIRDEAMEAELDNKKADEAPAEVKAEEAPAE